MPGYAYQRNPIEYSRDEQLTQDSVYEPHNTPPALRSCSVSIPAPDNTGLNKDSVFYLPVFSIFIKELGNQWWNVLAEKWQDKLTLLDVSVDRLAEIRSILTDSSSSLLVRATKLEDIILQLDMECDDTLEIQEVLSLFRQIMLAVEGMERNAWGANFLLSIFPLINKMLENDYFRSMVGSNNARVWKSRIDQAEGCALLFSDLSKQSPDNPLGYIETLFESKFSPAGINEIISNMRELFEHLDKYYQTQISRQQPSAEISALGNYLLKYQEENSVHKKVLVLVELIMDEDLFDSIRPIVDQIFPDVTLGLRLTGIIRDELPSPAPGGSAEFSWLAPAFSFLDADFRSKIHQEITDSNSAVANVIDSMLTRTENFLALDSVVVKLISAFFKFKNNKMTWKEFSSTLVSATGFYSFSIRERVSNFVADQINVGKEKIDAIVSNITNIDFDSLRDKPWKDYPGLVASAIYQKLPDVKTALCYIADKTQYGEEIRLAIDLISQIIKDGGTRWCETLLQKMSAYGQDTVFYKLAVIVVNVGLASIMWCACSDSGDPDMRRKNIKEAQFFLDSVLSYLPACGFEHTRELAGCRFYIAYGKTSKKFRILTKAIS